MTMDIEEINDYLRKNGVDVDNIKQSLRLPLSESQKIELSIEFLECKIKELETRIKELEDV